MNLTEKDVQILTQVAFKAAVDQFDGAPLADPETYSEFEGRIVALTDTLVTAISLATEKHAKSAAAAPRPAAGAPAPSTAAGGDGFTVTVKGEQHGPLPAWLLTAAAEKGVTEVWDNRGKLGENPRLPWFKATTADIPFWDPASKPKGKGR